ncbi:hypothetical protein JS561_05090 [Salmonella enterica subsp. enterica serovar Infantis]|nr:hypothetical protein JS561_05090 [Salmonella enterica subsp. enterica serovar Infantis]
MDASDADDEAAAAVLAVSADAALADASRLLWSPYLRCSPQMLRMKLPTKIPLKPACQGWFFMPTIKS